MGCDFATKSCMELMDASKRSKGDDQASNKSPFCSDLMVSSPRTSCTDDGRSVGSCNLVQFRSPLPEKFQNFRSVDGVSKRDLGRVGSSVALADFCPYVQEFTWRTVNSGSDKKPAAAKPRGTRCTEEENQPSGANNYALESYGRTARCFEQGSKWEQRSCRCESVV